LPRPMHFELFVDDPEESAKFYQDVFGWKVHRWDGPVEYWLVQTGDGPGINGAIAHAGTKPAHIINTMDVANLDEALTKLQASGGQVVAPKMALPGVGYMAYCIDPQGLAFGLMQNDPSVQ
jgi:uncharacterized protein